MVIDFTTNEFKKFNAPYHLNVLTRNKYIVNKPVNNKITITMDINGKLYDFIYWYKTNKQVYEIIRNRDKDTTLNLRYTYIKDFDINKVSNYKNIELSNFDASYSFWDGDTNFFRTKFIGNIADFSNSNFGYGKKDFSYITFNVDTINFKGINFGDGLIDFGNTEFKGTTNFLCADFGSSDVVFDKTKFNNNASFEKSHFGKGDKYFRESQFEKGKLDFYKADFNDGNVDFKSAKFKNTEVLFGHSIVGDGTFNLSNASFKVTKVSFNSINFGNGDVIFNNAKFDNSDADFSFVQFNNGKIDFSKITSSNLFFTESIFNCCKLMFDEGTVAGDIYFHSTEFNNGNISFYGLLTHNIYFTNNILTTHIDLRTKNIHELSIENCIIEKTLKCDKFQGKFIKYNKLSFRNTKNLGHIYIDWQNNNVKNSILSSTCNSKNTRKTKEVLYSQFRMLKENFHNIGQYEDEDSAYTSYMNYKSNCLIRIFDLIGGYGTRPLSILITMLFVWFIFGIIYYFELINQFNIVNETNTIIQSIKNIWDALYYSGITFLTIGYGDIAPSITGYGLKFTSIIEGFLGLFLMSYLTVAIVRKILR